MRRWNANRQDGEHWDPREIREELFKFNTHVKPSFLHGLLYLS